MIEIIIALTLLNVLTMGLFAWFVYFGSKRERELVRAMLSKTAYEFTGSSAPAKHEPVAPTELISINDLSSQSFEDLIKRQLETESDLKA